MLSILKILAIAGPRTKVSLLRFFLRYSPIFFDSVNDIPNYSALLKERHGLYNFMGLYTEGKYDSTGHLICYYWEAGVM